MYDLDIRRIQFSNEADVMLKMLKARTGITPNILCRMALCLSLDEPGVPRPVLGEKSTREINRFTLLGEYDLAFMSLVKVRLDQDQVAAADAEVAFVNHVHRGIALLANRMKSLTDLAGLVVTAES